MSDSVHHLELADRSIAFRLRYGKTPALVFLPGYASDMEGAKALALDALAQRLGLAMLRFDYSGTGASGGSFERGTLERWLEDATAAIDRLVSGPLVLVGSSMGGWIALHLALLRPERIKALVGLAAAPDFTQWGLSDHEKATLNSVGRLEQPTIITREFWESAQRLLLLGETLRIDCPVRLVHGECDDEVPLDVPLRLLSLLRSADVQLNVIKGGGHRLSEPHEIDVILRTIDNLLEPAP